MSNIQNSSVFSLNNRLVKVCVLVGVAGVLRGGERRDKRRPGCDAERPKESKRRYAREHAGR